MSSNHRVALMGWLCLFFLVIVWSGVSRELRADDDPPEPSASTSAAETGESPEAVAASVDDAADQTDDPGVLPVLSDLVLNQAADGYETAVQVTAAALPEKSRIVYIPYDDLNQVLGNAAAGVMVPLEEYLDLRRKAETAGVAEGRDPLPALITSSHYVARVDGDFVRIQAELTVNVLGRPWVELPIRFGQAAVGEVGGQNEMLFLRGTDDGNYALMLGERGRHTITLELLVRIQTSPDGKQIVFDCPPSPVTTFEFVVPETGQTIDITPSIVGVPVEQAAGETRVKVNLGATGQIAARWYPKAGFMPEMELLVGADNLQQVRIEDGQVHTHAIIQYEILRGTFDVLQVSVPLDHRILSVESATRLKGWTVERTDVRQLVTVELLDPAAALSLTLHTERPLPVGPVSLLGTDVDGRPLGIHPIGVVRENGQIVVDHGSDLELTVVDQTGLLRMDPAQAAPALQGQHALGYRFYGGSTTLQVEIRSVVPRITAVQSTQLVFESDELKLTTDAQLLVERAGLFEFRWRIPEGLTIDQVHGERLRDYRVDNAEQVLIASLIDRTQGALTLRIEGHVRYEAGAEERELSLPIPEPLGVDRETGTILVFAEESIEVITQEGRVESALPASANSGLRSGRSLLVSAWTYSRRPVSITVTTRRKATRLSANLATTIHVSPELIEVDSLLEYIVEFAGVDTFLFQVPDTVQGLQIEAVSNDPSAPGIKQRTMGPPADGWVTWTVVMQREVLGRQRFRLFHEVHGDLAAASGATGAPQADPVDDDATAAPEADTAGTEDASGERPAPESGAASIELWLPIPLGLPAQRGREEVPISKLQGEVVIRQDVTLTVSSAAAGGDVEAMDVRELTLLPSQGTAAYRYHKIPDDGGISVTVLRSRPKVQEVVETVVSKALVEITTGEDQVAHYHVRLRVRSAERQRIRIDLPKGLRILDVAVDGRESRLEPVDPSDSDENFDAFWLDVTRTGGAEEEFLLSFQFQWDITNPPSQSEFGRGRLRLPMPVLGGPRGSVAVQELRVVVRIPQDYVLVGDPSRFTLTNRFIWKGLFSPLETTCDTASLDEWIGGGSGPTTSSMTGTLGLQAFRYDNLGGARMLELVWWRRWWMTSLFSGAIALIGLLLWRSSWENKLTLVLLVILIGAIVGLRDIHLVRQTLAASTYGILFVVGMWIVQAGSCLCRSCRVGRNTGSAPPIAGGGQPHPEAPAAS